MGLRTSRTLLDSASSVGQHEHGRGKGPEFRSGGPPCASARRPAPLHSSALGLRELHFSGSLVLWLWDGSASGKYWGWAGGGTRGRAVRFLPACPPPIALLPRGYISRGCTPGSGILLLFRIPLPGCGRTTRPLLWVELCLPNRPVDVP